MHYKYINHYYSFIIIILYINTFIQIYKFIHKILFLLLFLLKKKRQVSVFVFLFFLCFILLFLFALSLFAFALWHFWKMVYGLCFCAAYAWCRWRVTSDGDDTVVIWGRRRHACICCCCDVPLKKGIDDVYMPLVWLYVYNHIKH